MNLVDAKELTDVFGAEPEVEEAIDWLIAEVERLSALVTEASKFFSPHSFDGEKVAWLNRANKEGV